MTLEYKLLGIQELITAKEINGIIYFNDELNENTIQVKVDELEKLVIAIKTTKGTKNEN